MVTLQAAVLHYKVDLSELSDMTADVVGSQDELILIMEVKYISKTNLSQFNNDIK